MATTKKTTKKSVKRFITPKEYDAIMDSFYKLRRKCFSLVECGKLNDTAEKQLRRFIKGLDKAKMDVLWGRATDFLKP